MMQPKILVMGAAGKTGSAVVAELRRRGARVRAVVRRRDDRSASLERQGAKLFVTDMLDAQQVALALRGATRAYYLPPFDPRMLDAATVFADAARDAGLESVVALSQWLASAQHPAWLTRQLWRMEALFARLPASLTIVAPPFFADNYLRLIGFAAHLGVLPSLTGDSRNAPPSSEDIAAVAAAALLDPAAHAGRRYHPTGPALLSTAEMARILSGVLGRRVRRVEMPMWLFLKAARMQGVRAEELSGFRYWVRDHREGAFAFNLPTEDVRQVSGREAETFEATARRYAALPEAQRSAAADLKAVAEFMRTPLAPGYDLDRYDRARGLAAPGGALFAMQNPEWRASRTRERSIPSGVRGLRRSGVSRRPHLTAAVVAGSLAAASSAAAQPDAGPVGPPGLPAVPVTRVIAIGHVTAKWTPEAIRTVMPREVRETVGLYLAGRLEQWFIRKDQPGVVFVFNATDVPSVHQLLEALPLGREGMMEFDLIPVGPLAPLGLLLAAPPGGRAGPKP